MEAFPESVPFGPYRLKAKIAQGGMADVLLATSTQKEFLGQFIALKRLLPHLNSNKAFVDLLIHEAKIGVLLNHPGIAQVYDLGSYKSEFFIAMEYIHGKSLDKVLERIKNQTAPKMPVEVSTYIILELLRALSFAHQLKDSKGRDLNIIHRDLSPGNILLGYRGEVKLVDFGIATAESRLQQGFAQTAMGKIAYMSPEQAVNDPVLKASDIYSLGVVYYELLTGQLPFQAEDANALLRKVIDGRATDIKMVGPAISPGLREIVTNCLNKSSRKRIQSCPELFQALSDHFKETLEVDFSSRATREYYKKKLCEYLRTVFEAEIITEIEIVQKALRESVASEELKATAPQEIPASMEKNEDFEATIFEADHTDEATRHYPLTPEERQKIMQGLSPREAIERQAFMEPTEKSKAQHAIFNLATIPEYDLAAEDSDFRRISVKEKLAISSLNKDEKETLKQQAPAQEITSQQELEAFEQSTFSGKSEVNDLATRPHDREQIAKDFEEIQKSKKQKTNPSVVKKIPPQPAEKESNHLLFWMFAIVISVGVAAGLIWALEKFYVSPLKRPALLPTQTIYLAMTGEVGAEKMLELSKLWAPDIEGLQDWFSNEYERNTSKNSNLLRVEIGEPEALIRGLSAQAAATDLIRSNEIFSFLSPVGAKRIQAFDALIYMYFYPFDPSSPPAFPFPQAFEGERPDRRGLVFVPAYSTKKAEVILQLAREIAFLYGAEDRDNTNSRNELMNRDAPTKNLQALSIGPQTAKELGWLP